MKPKVVLCVGDYNASWRKEISLQIWKQKPQHCEVMFLTQSSSLLGYCFNQLWARALIEHDQDHNVKYFCMLHADVVPQVDNWLDLLIEEMEMNNAQVLSAVVPIKDHTGSTSTAVSTDGNIWDTRKLTLAECEQLPDTFDIDDVRETFPELSHVDSPLLVNTGLMLVDLSNGWASETDDQGHLKAYFTIKDRIRRNGTQYEVAVVPEDWRFSQMAHEAGCKVCATTRVPLVHIGMHGYANFSKMPKPNTQEAVA